MSKSKDLFSFEGYAIPLPLLMATGGGPDTFSVISETHIRNITETCGLGPGMNVLEIGCGIGRDAIPLTKILGPNDSYLGIDIIRDSINWCSSNISRRHSNFRFLHFDIKDQLHNPGGTFKTADLPIPLENSGTDLIILQSVFTHMFERDIVFYLQEFRRVLRPNGRIYATCFIVDPLVLRSARATNLTQYDLSFKFSVGRGCYINNPEVPAGAVAYEYDAICRMVRRAGLLPAQDYLRGGWSGLYENTKDGQDVLILKPKTDSVPSHEIIDAQEAYLGAIEKRLDASEPHYDGTPLPRPTKWKLW